MQPTIVSVSVNYADTLEIAGLSWKRLTPRVVVVTDNQDEHTAQVCKDLGFSLVRTDAFYEGGAPFNKGKALSHLLSRCAGIFDASPGWILHLDADIVIPEKTIDQLHRVVPDPTKLYGAPRFVVPSRYAIKQADPFIPYHTRLAYIPPDSAAFEHGLVRGYFQLYHTSQRKPYPERFQTAETCDIQFAKQWAERDRVVYMEQTAAYHLGPTVVNWLGRVSDPF